MPTEDVLDQHVVLDDRDMGSSEPVADHGGLRQLLGKTALLAETAELGLHVELAQVEVTDDQVREDLPGIDLRRARTETFGQNEVFLDALAAEAERLALLDQATEQPPVDALELSSPDLISLEFESQEADQN